MPAFAGLDDLQFASPIEAAAARANEAAYEELLPICGAQIRVATGQCSGEVFQTFEHVRELVDTANELTGTGPTTYSLGLSVEALGFALRWTAAEELAAQGSAATRFSNSQLNALGNRISALRFGLAGPRVADAQDKDSDGKYAHRSGALGGSAGDDDGSIVERWGGFIDGSYGYGHKSDTTFSDHSEDAFDYDGKEASAGVDYRLTNSFVIGVMGGYSDKRIDFDSSVSIVDGNMSSKGYSAIAYALWEIKDLYVTGSLGSQWLDHDLVRGIHYPSLNPLVAPIDETARSSTSSSAILATFGIGYDLHAKAFLVEPYLKAEYQNISIDAFTEHGGNGFDFDFAKQKIKQLDTAAGIKFQYVFTPGFGVVTPYVRGELHHDFDNNARTIDAVYSSIDSFAGSAGTAFALQTDKPDDSYSLVAAGLSIVLQHGLQGFLQYQQTLGLQNYSDHAIAGGIRLEF